MIDIRRPFAAVLALGVASCSSGAEPNPSPDAASQLGADRGSFDLGPGVLDATTFFPDAAPDPDSGEPMMLADAGPSGLCPPSAPFGVRMGDVLPEPAWVDCDGQPVSMHALCDRKAVWQFHFAGW